MIALATEAARMRLSVLVTLRGLVSEMRPVGFLGKRKRRPRLKSGGGGWPLQIARKTEKRIGAANSGAALQAAKEIPSGPGDELFEFWMASVIEEREISRIRSHLTRLL